MYDIELKKELLEFKVGSDTIEDLQYRYEQIIKIIINRTKEKKYFLDMMLANNIINQKQYKQYMDITNNDYTICKLYLQGLITEYEI